MNGRFCALFFLGAMLVAAQQAPTEESTAPPPILSTRTAQAESAPGMKHYVVKAGTRIPLSMINSISTRHSAEGDRVYLETTFPILDEGKIVIPPGSYVSATVTSVKAPGRARGRGELFIRFDSLTLPNGVTRNFRARVSTIDATGGEKLDREEGKIESPGNKSGDARSVGEATAAGASVGAIAGSVGGRPGMGAGIGAAAGATAGLVGVLLSRGPDAVLARGSSVEMVLDRDLEFTEEELDFSNAMARPARVVPAPARAGEPQNHTLPGRRFP